MQGFQPGLLSLLLEPTPGGGFDLNQFQKLAGADSQSLRGAGRFKLSSRKLIECECENAGEIRILRIDRDPLTTRVLNPERIFRRRLGK